jgi:hypothetical protein
VPARDAFHEHVRHALERDGWTITHDPLHIKLKKRNLYVDLGAERLLAAEKGPRKIAVEIKTFGGPSDVRDLEEAVGQFVLYDLALRRQEPGRSLYLAVTESIWQAVFADAFGAIVVDERAVRLLTFNPKTEEIIRWIP